MNVRPSKATNGRVVLASELKIARVESLLCSTEAKLTQVQGQRKVTEQAIAILLNMAQASFTIELVKAIRLEDFTIPQIILLGATSSCHLSRYFRLPQ